MSLYPCLALALALPQDPDPPAQPPQEEPVELPATVVTARKVEELLEDVPGSVSVVGAREIDASGARSLQDIVGRIPNLRLTEFTARRLSFPFIRGIGSGQGEPAVTTYVDGVPQLATGSTNLPLVGLERVEFLRGPQGTLYGRNALGGVIHMISARPGAQLGGDAEVTFGNFDLQEYRAGVSGPVGDGGTLFSFDGFYSKRDGYTKNEVTGKDVDDRDAFFGRGQVYFNPTQDSELRVGLYAEHARDGGFALFDIGALRDRPHRLANDFEGDTERDVVAPSVVYTHTGSDFELTSITAYTDWDIHETSDFDFSAFDGLIRTTDEDQQYVYQEVRVASTAEEGTRWLVGISGFISDSDRAAENDSRFPPVPAIDTNSGDFDDTGVGIFGQVTVPVGERWEVTGGLRLDHEEREADLTHAVLVGGFAVLVEDRDFDEDFDEVAPMVSARYRPGEDTTVYALAANAWQAGGINLTAPPGSFEFDSEESWTYELGVKQSLADDQVRLRAAIFQIDWDDMQLSQFDPVTMTGFVDNVGESESRGIEVEVDADLAPGLTGFASFGFTDTELDDFVGVFGPVNDGNSLPFAPERTWSLGLQYETEIREGLDFFVLGEYVAADTFFYGVDNFENESFELTNLRAGVRAGDWTVAAWVRNVFDEEYIPIAFALAPTQFVGESGAPRTIGISIQFSF